MWVRVLGALLAAGLAAHAIPAAPFASANGDSFEIFRTTEGPYEIIVGVQPRTPVVGVIHFTITPLDSRTSAPIRDARIDLVARDPGGAAAYRVKALNSPAAPEYYDANLTIKSPGSWTLVVEVRTEALGQVVIEAPLVVGDPQIEAGLGGLLVWLLVSAAFLAGALYLWRTSRRLTAGR